MNRQRKHSNRTLQQTPFEIDMMIPGFGQATGRPSDRFRCSAETRNAKVLEQRRDMITDLGQRFLYDLLVARLAGKISTEELASAYRAPPQKLKALLDESQKLLLQPRRDRWARESGAQSINKYLIQVDSFIEFAGGPDRATVSDLTTERISAWRASLFDGRSGRAGRKASSDNPEAVARRAHRQAMKASAPSAPRPMSDATKNRYRAGLSVFCTYLTNVLKVLFKNPITAMQLTSFAEPDARMPAMDQEHWPDYCKALASDPPRTA